MNGFPQLQDKFGRRITYLRLSLTDRCDFRCTYCMSEKMEFMPRSEILALEEYLLIARVFVESGVSKIRLTGGEPLVRKNMLWLVERIRKLDGLRELTLTTNGSQLSWLAKPLAQAGIDRLNISLDSLDAESFSRITRTGNLHQVLKGLDAAISALGSRRIKLNCVVQRGVNLHELPDLMRFALAQAVDISFIEQMPLGKTGQHFADSFYSNQELLAQLNQQFEMVPSVESSGGPAHYWRIPGHETRIGFISPNTRNFCATCNRMRVTARGELFPCLGNENKVNLLRSARAGDEAELRKLILDAVATKPYAHLFGLSEDEPRIVRFMSHTGG
jgi:cyclic pyranopterin phosphate synthase